jgi:hypothetical protein
MFDSTGRLLFLVAVVPFVLSAAEVQNLSSFVDSTGVQHVIYQDTSGHINQMYLSGSWVNQNLSAYGGSPYLGTYLTSWVDQSNGVHIAYEANGNEHVNQLYWNGSTWINQDITAMSGGSLTTGPFTSWVDHSGGQHVAYFISGAHIEQAFYTSSGWAHQDLTNLGGGNPVDGETYISGWVDNSGAQHVAYEDTSLRINQLLYSGGSTWSNQDLTAAYGGSPVQYSALTAFVDASGGQHIGYFGAFTGYTNPVEQLWWNGSRWTYQNLSALTSSTGYYLTITSFVDGAGGMHYAYFDINGNVNVLTSYGGTTWSNQNVTAIAGGSPDNRSDLTSWVDHSGGIHIAYVDLNAHLNQLYWNGSSWTNQDLTALTHGPNVEI